MHTDRHTGICTYTYAHNTHTHTHIHTHTHTHTHGDTDTHNTHTERQTLIVRIYWAILLQLVGLTAGRLIDEIQSDFRFHDF